MVGDQGKIARWRYAKKKGSITRYLVYEIYSDSEWVVEKAYPVIDGKVECAAVARYDRLLELGYSVHFSTTDEEI